MTAAGRDAMGRPLRRAVGVLVASRDTVAGTAAFSDIPDVALLPPPLTGRPTTVCIPVGSSSRNHPCLLVLDSDIVPVAAAVVVLDEDCMESVENRVEEVTGHPMTAPQHLLAMFHLVANQIAGFSTVINKWRLRSKHTPCEGQTKDKEKH